MVTFNEHIGYNEAMVRGRAQDKALLNLITSNAISTAPDMKKEELKGVLEKVQQETEKILKEANTGVL